MWRERGAAGGEVSSFAQYLALCLLLAVRSENICYRTNLTLGRAHNHICVLRDWNQAHSEAAFGSDIV